MKKALLLVLIIQLVIIKANAQVELNAYAGYIPGAKTAYAYNGYRLRIKGGDNFGLGISKQIASLLSIELSYNHFSSTLKQVGGLLEVIPPQKIIVEYYQVGVIKNLMQGGELTPYGLFSFGASRFAPNEYSEDFWQFALNAGLGVKFFFTDNLGVRLQTRILMPLYFSGVTIGCSIGGGGGGCGTGLGMSSEILQADFTGGIVLKIASPN